MSLPAPIRISEEASLIRAALAEWTDARGGYSKVVAGMKHLWEDLQTGSEKPRCLVMYNGETARGGFQHGNTMHRVERRWQVVVVYGHGFKNNLTESPSGEPFMDSLETLREIVRNLLNISEEPVDYTNIKPVPALMPTQTANVFLDAFTIEFNTANDIPGVELAPSEQQ